MKAYPTSARAAPPFTPLEAGERHRHHELALETLTREARESDSGATREEIERQVADALAHDPQGEFAAHFLEVLQAERARELDPFNQRDVEPSPQAVGADQQEAAIEAAFEPDLDLEDGPDFDDGPSYG